MELVNITIGNVKARGQAKVSPFYSPDSPLPELQYDVDGKLVLPTWKREPIGYVLIELRDSKWAEFHLKVVSDNLIRCLMVDQTIYATEQEAIEALKRFKV